MNELKSKFKGIEQEETTVPDWHMDIVRKRLDNYKNNPEQVMGFDDAIDDIEKSL